RWRTMRVRAAMRPYGIEWRGLIEKWRRRDRGRCSSSGRTNARVAERPSRPAYRAATGVVFLAFAAFFRLSGGDAPTFLVNRSTRRAVSISFWRPVKNG